MKQDELVQHFTNRDDDFWDVEPSTDDEGSYFRKSGCSGVACTGIALEILAKLGPERVSVYGFFCEDNPGTIIETLADGHDFAVVDNEFIVDPWISEIEHATPSGVFHLERDAETVLKIYGPCDKWKLWDAAEALEGAFMRVPKGATNG